MSDTAPAQRRATTFVPHRTLREDRADNSILLRSAYPLPTPARSTGEWLDKWAAATPHRVFLAERSGPGWREITYAETLQAVRAIAASLLERGLDAHRPIAILSGNSIDHALLALAGQYVGIPAVPVAEQYALIPAAHGRLAHVLGMVRPGLVYARDAGQFAQALALPQLADVEAVASVPGGGPVTPFARLLKGNGGPIVDAANAAVGPDTLAKIMFTSGSSGTPKGVRTTHGMMCVNQAQIAACLPFVRERPPSIMDWLPWNHVFGGSHNFNLILANGGTLCIDNGKPTPDQFALSLENIRQRAGTLSFNVPVAYAMLLPVLRDDADLRRSFFAELDLIFYAGASLPQEVWGALEAYAIQERGSLPLMVSSWGMTETAPATIMVHEPVERSGIIGVPVPGTTVKLLPDRDGRYELRVAGPNVMAGYHNDGPRTEAAFDAEGFLVTGDAVAFRDPANPAAGLVFDGRISDDFKLSTGTWVQASKLRLEVLDALAPLVRDVVVCGADRGEVGVLILPREAVAEGHTDGGACTDPALLRDIGTRLSALALDATGTSKRVARALVLAAPPSVEAQEITDKGSLNRGRVLANRSALLDRLYDNADAAVIRISKE